jgi:2-hydroxy-3-oxopropionate reductase
MVLRMLAAGHKVTVWNRTAAKLAPVLEAGARAAPTPAAAAGDSKTMPLCLFDAAAVDEVVFGRNGIASVRNAALLVDHSSISPAATRDFATRISAFGGPEWIDAPVSGGIAGAAAGKLTVMAGGSPDSIKSATDVIRAYADRVVRVGPVGSGQIAKLCNQTIVAATILAIAEAVTLAGNGGIDPAQLHEVLAGGWADSRLLQLFVPRMTSLPANNIGSIATLLKDVESIAQLAGESAVPMPLSGAVLHTLRMTAKLGLGDADLSRVVRMLERSDSRPKSLTE